MTTLFVGIDAVDFETNGAYTVSQDTTTYRSQYGSGGITLAGSSSLTAGFAPVGRLWLSAQVFKYRLTTAGPLFQFSDSSQGVTPVAILVNYVGSLVLTVGGTAVAHTLPTIDGTLAKIDVLVDYAAGRVQIYASGLLLDYAGTLAPSGSTQLDTVLLTNPGKDGDGGSTTFSEVLVSTSNTRTASVITVAHQAGPVQLPGGTVPVTALKVIEASQGDGQSPDTINIGLGNSATSYAGPDIPLANGLTTANSVLFATNPLTGAAWAPGDLNGLNISINLSATTDNYILDDDGQPLVTDDGSDIVG